MVGIRDILKFYMRVIFRTLGYAALLYADSFLGHENEEEFVNKSLASYREVLIDASGVAMNMHIATLPRGGSMPGVSATLAYLDSE
jgi:hypothetical protein